MEVRWSERARSDLAGILAYYLAEAPHVASAMVERIFDAGESLADAPHRGRPVTSSIRELTIARPYVIRYRVGKDVVEILRVRHGARRPLR